MNDRRVCEKFKIERIYWRRRDIDWGYVTEEDLPLGLIENANLIHPFYFLSDLAPLTEKEVSKIAFYLTSRVRLEEVPLLDIVNDSDQKFGLPPGKSFSVACHLIGRMTWRVDLCNPITVKERLVLL